MLETIIISGMAFALLGWIVRDIAQSKKPLIKGDEVFNQENDNEN